MLQGEEMVRPMTKKTLLLLGFYCLLQASLAFLCGSDAVAGTRLAPLVLAYQPLASPGGALGATLQRDRILRQSLERLGFSIKMVAVKDGGEATRLLASGGAAVCTMGDMPLLKAAGELQLYAIALIKQNYASVVGQKGLLPSDLKGKRIGYNFGSSGHFALMKTLAGSGLSESDAVLVPLDVTDMEEALLQGRIDAYAAWTPTPEMTLARYPDRFTAIGKQKSLGFVVIARPLADRHPELPSLLTAALVRALNWFGKEGMALELAAGWNLRDIDALKGRPGRQMKQAQLSEDLRREFAAIGNSPRLPKGIDAEGSYLAEEFHFLKKLGKIPASAAWSTLQPMFGFRYLDRVLKNTKKYQTARFDYEKN